jgi:hypothetical protein
MIAYGDCSPGLEIVHKNTIVAGPREQMPYRENMSVHWAMPPPRARMSVPFETTKRDPRAVVLWL